MKPIYHTPADWSLQDIEHFDQHIARIAGQYQLDTYSNQLEVISAEQMIDAYTSVGLPIGYYHWSFGKHFEQTRQLYESGRMGLAYELVINSSPCIAYLMEENSLVMQALVIAHASYGHNSFFKGNYLFREWTDATAIVDYMVFAKSYLHKCEAQYGIDVVEQLLDSCHALMSHGVNRYHRPVPPTRDQEQARQAEREVQLQQQVNLLWSTLPDSANEEVEGDAKQKFPIEPEENLLYFIEKHSPILDPWQREVVRIVRKVAQYFYPQKQTKVMNEGWACFWHYTIVHQLYKERLVDDGFMLEFFDIHSRVLRQPAYDEPGYSGINPYTLGFAMMRDIKRICETPRAEDKYWFPQLANSDWSTALDFAMRNFNDESFILQYLSPQVMRALKLFNVEDFAGREQLLVSAIHDESGYKKIRQALAATFSLEAMEPNIQVVNVDLHGDRSLTLEHCRYLGRPMGGDIELILQHIKSLWGFDVKLRSVAEDGKLMRNYEV